MSWRDPSLRNVALLSGCQALAMTGMTINMTVTALVGQQLAPDPALSTLPLALQFTTAMAVTVPVSLLMKRIGRRGGFAVGVALGVCGSLIAATAIYLASYLGFVIGTMLIGGFHAVSLFYRYAAADTASAAFKSQAISLVVAGGVVAAFTGPELAKWAYDLVNPFIFLGCFLVIAVLHAAILILLALVRIPPPSEEEQTGTGRPLLVIARQPRFIIAVTGAMIGYGVMSFIMTATPLAVVGCGLHFNDAAFVVQWHSVAMFAPSFVTGTLIARFGVDRIMLIGALMLLFTVVANVTGLDILNFLTGMILLGVGWNFLFVGGTTLLTETYRPAEKARVQGFNDFLVLATTAAASFASGALLNLFGWEAVNFGVLPFIAVVLTLLVWQMARRQPALG